MKKNLKSRLFIHKDRFFLIFTILTIIIQISFNISHIILIRNVQSKVGYNYAIFDTYPTYLNEESDSLDISNLNSIWRNELVFQFLEITNIDLFSKNDDILGENLCSLFSNDTNSFFNYLMTKKIITLEGNMPSNLTEVVISRNLYYNMLDYYNSTNLIGNTIPINIQYGTTQFANYSINLTISGVFDIDLNQEEVKNLLEYNKIIWIWSSYYNNWIETSLRFYVDIFDTNLIFGSKLLGEILFNNFFNTDPFNHFLLRYTIFKNSSNSSIKHIMESDFIQNSLNSLNNNDLNNYNWEITKGDLIVFKMEYDTINKWLLGIFILLYIFILFLIFLLRFHYYNSITQELNEEIERFIVIGYTKKKIINIYLKKELKHLNLSILISFIVSFLINVVILSILMVPVLKTMYFLFLNFTLLMFLINNSTFLSFVKIKVNNLIDLYISLEIIDDGEIVNDRKRNKRYINIYKILIAISVFILLIPLFIPKELVLENSLIFEGIPGIEQLFPIEWTSILGTIPLLIPLYVFILPVFLVYLIYPLFNKIQIKIKKVKREVKRIISKIIDSNINSKKPIIFCIIFLFVVVFSVVNTSFLSQNYDKNLQEANFGPDIICYERDFTNFTQEFKQNYTSIFSKYENIANYSYIYDSQFYFGEYKYTSGGPFEQHEMVILNSTNYLSVINYENIVCDKINISGEIYNQIDSFELLLNFFQEFQLNSNNIIISKKFAQRYGLEIDKNPIINLTLRDTNNTEKKSYLNNTFFIKGIFSFLPGIDLDYYDAIFQENYSFEKLNPRIFIDITGKNSRETLKNMATTLWIDNSFQFPVIEFNNYIQSSSLWIIVIINNIMYPFFIVGVLLICVLYFIDINSVQTQRKLINNIGFSEKKSYLIQIKIKVKEFTNIIFFTLLISLFFIYINYKIQYMVYIFGITYFDPFGQFGEYKGGDSLPYNDIFPFKFEISNILIFFVILYICIVILSLILKYYIYFHQYPKNSIEK